MTNFNLIDIFVQVFNDMFEYLGLEHKFMCEVPESTLNSSEKVNALIGISGDISGNILFGFTEKIAREVSAKLIGVKEINQIDKYEKNALADFYADFCARVTHSIKIENLFNIDGAGKDYVMFSSNPTYIAGDNMQGVISKVPSKKLFFKVCGEKFGIAYNLEQK